MNACRLTKVTHKEGQPVGNGSGGPIIEGYQVEGYFTNPPIVGSPFSIFRTSRNGVQSDGIFTTSDVLVVGDDGYIHTRNSIYRFEVTQQSTPLHHERKRN